MMETTLVSFECETCLLGKSYTIRLVRIDSEEEAEFMLLYDYFYDSMQPAPTRKVRATRGVIEQWFHPLERANVPAIMDGLAGCDGVTYRLNYCGGVNQTCYQWWCDAPEGYRPLVNFVSQLQLAVSCHDRLRTRKPVRG